jgi:hypothetical protein
MRRQTATLLITCAHSGPTWRRQDLAQRLAGRSPPPLIRVAHGDLSETDTIVNGLARDVQVPIDRVDRGEPLVPVGRGLGATPLCELCIAQQPRKVAYQRVVVDQYLWQGWVQCREPRLRGRDPRMAPVPPARVGIGMQQELQ